CLCDFVAHHLSPHCHAVPLPNKIRLEPAFRNRVIMMIEIWPLNYGAVYLDTLVVPGRVAEVGGN
ncbi:MAG: hypothetical protein ABIF71_04630, partial [Planctomycetota bacterium]